MWRALTGSRRTDYVEQLSSGQCGLSDGSSAGDWRLPNNRELVIIDRAETDTYAYLNFAAGHPFVIGDDSEYGAGRRPITPVSLFMLLRVFCLPMVRLVY